MRSDSRGTALGKKGIPSSQEKVSLLGRPSKFSQYQ